MARLLAFKVTIAQMTCYEFARRGVTPIDMHAILVLRTKELWTMVFLRCKGFTLWRVSYRLPVWPPPSRAIRLC